MRSIQFIPEIHNRRNVGSLVSVRYHKRMAHFPPGQTLLIDADDTLWENNVYFERAIAAFIGYLDHREYTPAEVRKVLNEVERETILAHGYGLPSFRRSLVACFERLSPAPMDDEKHRRVIGFWSRLSRFDRAILVVFVLVLIIAAIGPLVAPYPPTFADPLQRLALDQSTSLLSA